MKLDRYQHGTGKYALVRLRKFDLAGASDEARLAGESTVAVPRHAIDFGDESGDSFFVLKARDQYALKALRAYQAGVMTEVEQLDAMLAWLNGAEVVDRQEIRKVRKQADSLREYAGDLLRLVKSWEQVETKQPD